MRMSGRADAAVDRLIRNRLRASHDHVRMMPARGESVQLTVEKPAAGGWMIARLNGQIVLVGGAIPGERVTARIERGRQGRRLRRYGQRDRIRRRIGDRWPPTPLRWMPLRAHRLPRGSSTSRVKLSPTRSDESGGSRCHRLSAWPPSPEEGYRMRARLHVRGRRAGFFREGTHDLCDARQTRQLLPATCDVLDQLGAALV